MSATGALLLGALGAVGHGQRRPPGPPPTPRILRLRNALVADINATIKPRSPVAFTARPAYSVLDTENLQVSVLSTDETETHDAGRETDTEHMQLNVVVRKKIDGWSVPDSDVCLSIAKAIEDRYEVDRDISELGGALVNIGQAVLVEKQWFPLYNRFLMDTTGYFHSELVLIFREWVDRDSPPLSSILAVADVAFATSAILPVTINVLANDIGTGLRVVSAETEGIGTANINPDNTITYKPHPTNGLSSIQFSYTIEDELGQQSSATVTVNFPTP